ncbi:nSTAND1 domain-containing NTPase [Nocardia transvalensis]
MRATRAPGQKGGVSIQRISDWKAGRNVPAKFETLLPVLLTLIDEARKSSRPVPPALLDTQEWQRVWTASNEWDPNSEAADVLCPYLGLAAYGREDAEVFFGRTRSTAELVDLVRDTAGPGGDGGLVMLVGASGAGKSSLLQAGVIPALADSAGEWTVAMMTPGVDPVGALLAATGAVGGAGGGSTGGVSVTEALGAWGVGGPRLLVVDQLEELFTLCHDERARDTFLDALEHLAIRGENSPAAVVLAVRADFYARCLDEPVLEDALKHRSYLLGPMRLNELAEAISRPADMAGYKLEPGLEELVISELCGLGGGGDRRGYDPGALPLVSHVMEAVWQRRDGSRLTIDGYRSAGGVLGSVSTTAEKAWGELSEFQQAVGKQVLLGLVAVGDDSRDTRRKVSRAELLRQTVEAADAALDMLARTRLVTLEADSAYLTHEIVLDAWPRLRSWIDEDRVGYLERQRLQSDATDWVAHQRDPSMLYRGARLVTMRGHARNGALGPVAQEFLDASEHARERAQRRSTLRRAGLVLLTVVSVTLAGVALLQSHNASRQRDNAVFNSILAEADRVESSDPSLSAQLTLVADRLRPGDPEVSARLINTQNLPLATPLAGHTGFVHGLAYRSDGRLLASAGSDRTVRLWDVSDRRNPHAVGSPLTGYPAYVRAVAFSSDGSILASLSEQIVVLWNVRDPANPVRLGDPIPVGYPTILRFGQDGRTLVTSGSDHPIVYWDVSEPAHPRMIGSPITPSPKARFYSVALSSDLRRAVLVEDIGPVQLWQVDDLFSNAVLLSRLPERAASAAISPDGNTVAVAADAIVKVWDVHAPSAPQQAAIPIVGGGTTVGTSLEFSGDGKTLVTEQDDRIPTLWDMHDPTHPTAAAPPLAGAEGFVGGVALAPDQRSLATTGQDGVVRIWSLPGGGSENWPRGSLLAARGNTVVVKTGSAAAEVWRIDDPVSAHRIGGLALDPEDPLLRAWISPDQRSVALTSTKRGVTLADISGAAAVRRIEHISDDRGRSVVATAFSSDSTRLAIAGLNGRNAAWIQLWDIADKAHPVPLGDPISADTEYVFDVQFAPGDRYLAASGRGIVEILDVANASVPRPVTRVRSGRADSGAYVSFAADGRTMASTSEDQSVRVWDVSDMAAPAPLGSPLTGHNAYVNAVVFDAAGDLLTSMDTSASVRLWDLSDRRDPRPIRHPAASAGTLSEGRVAFFDNDRYLIATGADGWLRLLSLDPEPSKARICDVTRTVLTPQVWRDHLPDLDYRPPCG